jgi:hypothetical protein
MAHPELKDKRIAKLVGVHPKTLNKPAWAQYRALREVLKNGPPPNGSKSADGTIEAYGEEREATF